MSDDTPTQRFDTPPPPSNYAQEQLEAQKKRRALMFALIALSAALLVVLIVVLIVLIGRDGTPTAATTPSGSATATASASASATAGATPSAGPTPTTTAAPPAQPQLALNSFSTTTQSVKCDNRTGNPIPITFRWVSTNGSAAYFGVNTDDAQTAGMGWDPMPSTGSDANFPDGYRPYTYPCYAPSETYTITVVDTAGHKVSKKVTITNTGDLHS